DNQGRTRTSRPGRQARSAAVGERENQCKSWRKSMRLRHADGTRVHLAYNAGVHPAEDLENLIAHLTRYAVPVRKPLGVERMGIGLWLSPAVADHLIADRIELVRLRRS